MNTSRHIALAIIVAGLAPLVTTVRANAEIVRVEFAGTMDFSSIGGNASHPYSGVFVYDTAVPPFESGVVNGMAYAHYQLTLVGFEMFGRTVPAALVAILVQDNNGSPTLSDFFTLTVHFGLTGVAIPGTNRMLKSIGVNAVAFPATMFSSTAFPRNLDIAQASTKMNDYAELTTGQLLVRDVPPAISNVVFTAQTPGAPTNFQASVSGNTVNMSWVAPTSGAPPTGYTVVVRTTGGQLLATVLVGNVATLSVGAPNGVYALSVRARNAAGSGPESNAVTVTVPQAVAAPAAPTNLTVSVVGTTANFTWVPGSGGGAVANYLLVAGTTPGFGIPTASVTLTGAPGASIPGVPPGTYYVRVLAVNAGGTSGPSNEVTVVVSGPGLPGTPTLNPAVVSSTTVSLSWVPGAGGVPTSYLLTAASAPGGSAIATVPLTGTSATFTNVPSGTYHLRLAAINAVGSSLASNEITVVVP